MNGYLLFTEEDLNNALAADQRFIVENPCDDQHFTEVRVIRKKGKNRKTSKSLCYPFHISIAISLLFPTKSTLTIEI